MTEVYLKYEAAMPIGVKGYWGDLCTHIFADIMYWTGETDEEINNEEDEGVVIGSMTWVTYNQALARVHGVNMTDIPFLAMQNNSEALFELDYTNITKETINEIGAASNPNITLLIHFGIIAEFRNKGLGEKVLKGFIEQMTGICGYVVVARNEPAQFGKYYSDDSRFTKQIMGLDSLEKDPEKAQWKLNAFWQRCGFKQFKNFANVFICNVDKVVSELFKPKAPAV